MFVNPGQTLFAVCLLRQHWLWLCLPCPCPFPCLPCPCSSPRPLVSSSFTQILSKTACGVIVNFSGCANKNAVRPEGATHNAQKFCSFAYPDKTHVFCCVFADISRRQTSLPTPRPPGVATVFSTAAFFAAGQAKAGPLSSSQDQRDSRGRSWCLLICNC